MTWLLGVGGGSVSASTSTTNAQGEATVRWTLGSSPGANTVNAVVSGVGFVGFSATATSGGGGGGSSGEPARLTFRVQPSDATKKDKISPAVQVAVLDRDGNRVTDREIEIKLELTGDRDGKLSGQTAGRTQSGVATFSELKVEKEGHYRLRATADGLPSVESDGFEIKKEGPHHH